MVVYFYNVYMAEQDFWDKADKAYSWGQRLKSFLEWIGLWSLLSGLVSSVVTAAIAYYQQVPGIFTAVLVFAVLTLTVILVNGVIVLRTKWKLTKPSETPTPVVPIPPGWTVVSREESFKAVSSSATYGNIIVLKKLD